MKAFVKMFAVALCLVLISAVAWGQTPYTWNAASGDYQVSTNWTPTRTTPLVTDILAFDGSVQASSTVTNVATQTIGRLVLTNNVSVGMTATSIVGLVIAGGSGTDFDVPSGSSLNISGSVIIQISLSIGATGSVAGTVSLAGAAHKLLAVDASGITFQNGSLCTLGTAFSSNAFGTTNLNSIVFASGSVYAQTAGANPFGAGTPNSVVVFQTGSLYRSTGAGPSFSGRTYADVDMNSGASISVTGTGAVTIDNLTVTSGTLNFNMTATPGHSIKGNISIASGAILAFAPSTAGTVNLNGSSAQTISGSGTQTSNGNSTIVINNANGVSLLNNAYVGNLTFTNGKLTLGPGVTIENEASRTISGASSSSYIVADVSQGSQFRRNGVGASDVVFPIGLSSSYNPVTINNADTPADYMVGVQSGFDAAPPNASACVNRQWNITEAAGGPSNSTLTFQWSTADQNGSFNPAASGVIGRYSTQWDEVSATITDLTGGVYSANASGFSSFSPFGVGNTGALPVALVALSASVNKLSAEIHWSTATEINNYGFDIERRNVGSNDWSKIGFVAGAGTSTSPRDYSYVDANLPAGRYAYRIKQIDNDGTFQYYGNAEVEIGAVAKEFKLESNYPNPFNPSTTIEFTVETDGLASLRVFNTLGQEVAALFEGEAQSGKSQRVKFDASWMPSGLYFARLESGKQRMIRKMVLMK